MGGSTGSDNLAMIDSLAMAAGRSAAPATASGTADPAVFTNSTATHAACAVSYYVLTGAGPYVLSGTNTAGTVRVVVPDGVTAAVAGARAGR